MGESGGIDWRRHDVNNYNPSMAIRILSVPPSGNVISVGWDSDDMSLYVEFKKGIVYKYHPVPEDIAMGFETSLSANQYLQLNIINQFEYVRVS
jgi:hypothetical protein